MRPRGREPVRADVPKRLRGREPVCTDVPMRLRGREPIRTDVPMRPRGYGHVRFTSLSLTLPPTPRSPYADGLMRPRRRSKKN
jgi:hypothetical protein